MKVTITSIDQVLPSVEITAPKSLALSHIDEWHSRGRSSLVWLYPKPKKPTQSLQLLDHLRSSLSQALNKFPQYAGKLSHSLQTGTSQKSKTRLCLTWGTGNDPGVHYITARASSPIDALLPPLGTSTGFTNGSGSYAWDRSGRSCIGLWPAVPLNKVYETCIQITTFECGGFSLSITMNHAVADATSVILFARHWSKTHELMVKVQTPSLSIAEPCFAPHLIDQYSTLELQDEGDNGKLLNKAHALPTLRNDLYESGARSLPDRLELSETYSVGDDIAVGDWERSGPMRSYMLHFSKEDINKIWESAKKEAGQDVSRQAAIVSYIWLAIIRAREWDKHGVCEPIKLFITFDVRRRLGLPDTLLGSPVLVTHVKFNGNDAISKSHGLLANRIWKTLSTYDVESVCAALYDITSSRPLISPAIWLGGRSTLFSSLCHADMYDVTFHETGPLLAAPAFAGMGGMIGLIKSKSAVPSRLPETYEDGIDMFFELDTESSIKLFSDPALSIFDGRALLQEFRQ
uniref:Acyltransferase AFT15-1 n=1 Tax=Alternaria alternata TaxID=5599 RepID=AF151_ALTAL|nr:RecName: Full=Acyltransferase AFT15-1; AltName: Full=AF-toxin biosynthesis protein 15-1 [Alternaria alternata]BAO10620.1 transferase family protein [Alternaria alternata]